MPNWDDVYTEKLIESASPSFVLSSNEHLLQKQGTALDFACGLSGNGQYLAKKGFSVKAWDLSQVAVEKINQYAKKNKLSLSADVRDLEKSLPDSQEQFDVVVVSYFLHRNTIRYLHDILKKDGLLFYQTFSGEPYKNQGPSRVEFRLHKNELLDVFSDMQLLFYREDDELSSANNSKQGEVHFVARK